MLPLHVWRIEAVFRLMVMIFLGLFGGMLLVAAFEAKANGAGVDVRLLQYIVSFFCLQGLGVLWITMFLKEHGMDWIDGFGLDRAALPSIGFGVTSMAVALPLALMVIGGLVLFILKQFGMEPEVQPTVTVIKDTTNGWQTAIFAFAAIVMAPLFEEGLFRGVLYPAFRNRGHRWLGLWVTAFLFGAIHMNIAAFLPLTFLAIVFTWLYERTGNLLAPIAGHSVFNAINFWLLVAPPDWKWLQKLTTQ